MAGMDEERMLLRHTLGTLAYRAARAIENATESFATFEGAVRQPVQILAHMGDLLHWALSLAQGNQRWHDSQPLGWKAEEQRFFDALAALDAFLESSAQIHAPMARIFQGPIADALTHTGQLAMLRRLAGEPIHGENFYVAAIKAGQVGAQQPAPVKSF